jgi:hypothetical protein
MANSYTSRNRTASTSLTTNGFYVGIVRKVDGKQVWVEIPAVSPGFAFGPSSVLAGVASYSSTTALTGDSSPVVTDIDQVPAVGRNVLCAFINNSLDEVVVLGAIL